MDVLVLEDDSVLARALNYVLKLGGYTPLRCADLSTAQALIGQGTLRAAILEVQFPRKGAVTIAQEIKRLDSTLPVVFLSRRFFDPSNLSMPPGRKLFDAFLSRPMWHFDILDALERLTSGTRHESLANLPRYGELARYPFATLLYQTTNAGFTGRVVLQRAATRRVIYMLNGFPVFASSNTLGEALGTLLIKRGLITRQQLRQELDLLAQGSRSLGQHLIHRGVLSETVLEEVLYEQVRERILSCFELVDGQFELFTGSTFAERYEHFVQNPIELIFLGVARFQETNQLAQNFAERASHYVVPTNKFDRLIPYIPLGRKRGHLLEQIDGRRTVQDLIRLWAGDITALFRFVWALQIARLVFFSRKPIPSSNRSLKSLLIPPEHLVQLVTPSQDLVLDAIPELTSSVIDLSEGQGFSELSSGLHKSPAQQSTSLLEKLTNKAKHVTDLNHFEIFDLDVDATPAEIRLSVEKTLRLLDPKEVSKLPPQLFSAAAQLWSHAQTASRVLLDPDARAAYIRELRPASTQNLLKEGRTLLKAGQYANAIELFQQVEAQDPANATAVTYHARCLHLLHGTEDRRVVSQCKALLYRAIALDEANPTPHYFLGELAMDRYVPEEAREHYERALQIDPAYEPATRGLEALGSEGPSTGNIRASFLKYDDS